MTEEQPHDSTVDDSTPADPVRSNGADGGLLTHVSRRAMATEFSVVLPQHFAHAVETAVAALEQLEAIERALTIYQPGSEISRVNRAAADQPVRVSGSTFALLQRAVEWYERTGGAFDVTSGPLVEAWGFTRRSGRKPTPEEIESALQCVGSHRLLLDAAKSTVQFEVPGMAINLGAIGKGFALDQVAAELRRREVADFLIHGGQSSLIARGNSQPDHDRGWPVGLSHPTKPKHRIGGLWLKDAALATSGSGKQFFHHKGRRYGHVIDPRTGSPAGDLLSLTVVLRQAADADACATGLFVLGAKATEDFQFHDHPVSMVRVRAGQRQDQVDVDWQGEIDWQQTPPESYSPDG